jgi:hypothetical protein
VADAKRLILEAIPPERSAEVYARVDENGDIDFEGPVDIREVHGVQIYASFIDRDFLPICEQLSIQPRMKYRPVFTDYNGDVSRDDTYTIAHDEFVNLAELFGLLVVTGEAPEPQPTTPSPAPVVAVGALNDEAWANKARDRAAEIIKRQREKDLFPSQKNLGDEIAREFRGAGIVGADGKPLSGAYIKRHALKGISSAQGKQLSTRTGRGK